jgi:hypothetical protein
MFMVHHFLARQGRDPAIALHRAQLWMRQHRAGTVPDLPAWAGFIHIGR